MISVIGLRLVWSTCDLCDQFGDPRGPGMSLGQSSMISVSSWSSSCEEFETWMVRTEFRYCSNLLSISR